MKRGIRNEDTRCLFIHQLRHQFDLQFQVGEHWEKVERS